mmetsp:Transcript_20054/g.63839  ORF Transcript_20054/g.63839 Transcript_20054/m.63839 type:complete len:274 (-) Transcript_20054:378-1199(-)
MALATPGPVPGSFGPPSSSCPPPARRHSQRQAAIPRLAASHWHRSSRSRNPFACSPSHVAKGAGSAAWAMMRGSAAGSPTVEPTKRSRGKGRYREKKEKCHAMYGTGGSSAAQAIPSSSATSSTKRMYTPSLSSGVGSHSTPSWSSLNSQGRMRAPLPVITAARPGIARVLLQSARVSTSPLPTTARPGFAAALRAMTSQSAAPVYRWAPVRPWTVTAAAPAACSLPSSSASASSSTSSSPSLSLSVRGTGSLLAIPLVSCTRSRPERIRATP